jgi:hypothetical protein
MTTQNSQSKIEYRIKLFQELSNNKWYHIMNYNLDVLKHIFNNKKDAFMVIKYGHVFYF